MQQVQSQIHLRAVVSPHGVFVAIRKGCSAGPDTRVGNRRAVFQAPLLHLHQVFLDSAHLAHHAW